MYTNNDNIVYAINYIYIYKELQNKKNIIKTKKII